MQSTLIVKTPVKLPRYFGFKRNRHQTNVALVRTSALVRSQFRENLNLFASMVGRSSIALTDIYHRQCQPGDILRLPFNTYLISHPRHFERIFSGRYEEAFPRSDKFNAFAAAIGRGLVTTDGTTWKKQRKIAQPFFKPKPLYEKTPQINAAVDRMRTRWDRYAHTAEPFDLMNECRIFSLDVLFGTAFGIDDISDGAQSIIDEMTTVFDGVWSRLAVKGALSKIHFLKALRFYRARRAFNALAESLLDQCATQTGTLPHQLSQVQTSLTMTPIQRFDNVKSFLFTGFDTTATALAWTFCYLSEFKAYQEQIARDENADWLHGQPQNLDKLYADSVAGRCLLESMRLRSPIHAVFRITDRETSFGDIKIRKNSRLVLFFAAAHRFPGFWEKPNEFFPDHFSSKSQNERHRFAYLPFGAGRHACIGKPLSMLTMLPAVQTLCRDFEFSSVMPGIPEPEETVLTHPRGKVLMKVSRRKSPSLSEEI